MKLKIDVEGGQNVFFISDFHLFHKNVIRFDDRPFLDEFGDADLHAMHQTLLENWNNTVRPNDFVFYMGDLCFGRWQWGEEFVKKLNGKIHFVMGNHDKYEHIVKTGRFLTVYDLVSLNIFNSKTKEDFHFIVCHYPILSWERMSRGSYHVHGHCHGNLHHGEFSGFYDNRKVIDAGCNLINYTPISYKEIITKFN